VAAFEDCAIIGVAVFDGSGVINGIGVDTHYRRRGLGRLLLDGVEQAARSKGFRRITLGSVDDATDFYLACGYRATLLVQFRTGEFDLHARAERLTKDLLKAHIIKRAEWEGSPQLFVQTNGVDWDLKQMVEKFDHGVVCQFIMVKDI
jgi:GNAT superfamily N-acetyltransferase